MFENKYPSVLLDNAVSEFAKLPGIGKKTALRLVLHILQKENEDVLYFTETINELKKNIKKCKICKNLSDNEICEICSDTERQREVICVVENIKDVLAIENTGQFKGYYHVLGGLISPMDGIGPDNLELESLVNRLNGSGINEMILALSPTPEGETTSFYISRKIKEFPIEITIPARGVAIGGEIEYTDEITLGRSIKNRIKFEYQ